MIRSLLAALLVATPIAAVAAETAPAPRLSPQVEDVLRTPVLRAHIEVADELVRIGDLIDNAGVAAQIAVYRAPDLGTTGALSTNAVIATLRAHQVIGVDTRDIREVTVTRLARSLPAKEIEKQVIEVLQRRHGLGDAEDLALTWDREIEARTLPANYSGAPMLVADRFDRRSGRFDLSFEISGGADNAPVRLRVTGTAVETAPVTVLTRPIERNEVIKVSDVAIERRPKAEVTSDTVTREAAIGMQTRRSLRGGQVMRTTDLTKPDLVTRDQSVTLIYEAAGIYLTSRGKALETGTEGDVVNVLNLQSKRTVPATVVGRGQVVVMVAVPRVLASAGGAASAVAPEPSIARSSAAKPE
ncbi:flagellar basal body P-ring formation protein FlgA [Rhodopseudomonas sp. HC1]|uniref:flagellar basal body P-ring formation chaperone FlgA n=1 Tax=Rhodopseudomonas infernalis TaxID=2897386 RepID=UPI001EE9262E|nr:flagellar basal body P-ring formation chaperone FlgA [Rhodopseudomonas infernalis]MCG6204515.1 flagellar basal body P-ring formation protein FlgA [Rhodopseudomonas infernalis]